MTVCNVVRVTSVSYQVLYGILYTRMISLDDHALGVYGRTLFILGMSAGGESSILTNDPTFAFR